MQVEELSRGVTLVITNCIKVAGLVIGVAEVFHHSASPDAITLAYSAFMMAGAQLSETTILRLIERFFGIKESDEK